MNSLFFEPKLQILVFILKVFILVNNQLLSTDNAKDINAGYCITNSTLASSYHGSVGERLGRRPLQNMRVQA